MPLPFGGVTRHVCPERLHTGPLVFGCPQAAAELGDVRVGADELQAARADETASGTLCDHQRRDAHELAVGCSQCAQRQQILNRGTTTPQVRPPGQRPCRRPKRQRVARLVLERNPFRLQRSQTVLVADRLDDEAWRGSDRLGNPTATPGRCIDADRCGPVGFSRVFELHPRPTKALHGLTAAHRQGVVGERFMDLHPPQSGVQPMSTVVEM